MAFSPDGRILASGGHDSSVILWDPQRGQQLGEPLQMPGDVGVNSLAFSPDGRILASGGHDSSVILWDPQSESGKGRACLTTTRNLTRSEWRKYLENEPYHETCSN